MNSVARQATTSSSNSTHNLGRTLRSTTASLSRRPSPNVVVLLLSHRRRHASPSVVVVVVLLRHRRRHPETATTVVVTLKRPPPSSFLHLFLLLLLRAVGWLCPQQICGTYCVTKQPDLKEYIEHGLKESAIVGIKFIIAPYVQDVLRKLRGSSVFYLSGDNPHWKSVKKMVSIADIMC